MGGQCRRYTRDGLRLRAELLSSNGRHKRAVNAAGISHHDSSLGEQQGP